MILGRTYADGSEADHEAVNALQAQYKVVSAFGVGQTLYEQGHCPLTPSPVSSMTDKPQSRHSRHGDGWNTLTAWQKLMGGNAPPAKEDAPIVETMAKIGIVLAKPSTCGKLDPAVASGTQGPTPTGAEKD